MKRSKAYQDADAKINHESLYSPGDASSWRRRPR